MRRFFLLGVLGALAACAPLPIPTADATATPRVTATRAAHAPATSTPLPADLPEGGSLVIGVIGDTNLELNVMPAIVQDTVFDSLLRVDATTGALIPSLADKYTVSDDATTITFRLRAEARWHDGAPLTADDVVATIQAFASPNFRGTPVTDFGPLARAAALDAQTVQIVFSSPYCPALTSIGTLKILPRAIATSANFPRLTPAQMIGTGALKFVSRERTEIVLARNAEYFAGAPHIETWTIRLFADTRALRDAFGAGEIDAFTAAPGDDAALEKLAHANIAAAASNQIIALLFNVDTPTLNDPRVRHALNYALDRTTLLNDIAGQGILLDASALPGYWAHPTDLPRFTFDIARARQLLAEAGWRDDGDGVVKKNGKPLRLELWTEADDPLLEPLAFRIREQYAALGVPVELELGDRAGWMTRAFQHRFDLLLITRKLPLDPDQRWYWQSDQNAKGSGFNFGSYANAPVDGWFADSLRAPACAPERRAALFGEIQRTLVVDPPAVFLLAPKKYLVARARVLGLAPSPFAGDFWNVNEWRVKP